MQYSNLSFDNIIEDKTRLNIRLKVTRTYIQPSLFENLKNFLIAS